MTSRGRPIEPAAITGTALMTVEGERDDISGLGQTAAAHKLCSSLKQRQRLHHEEPGVGHYGVFNGRKWRRNIAPRIAGFIRRHEGT
jgi:poly(3-hydroxybutyrate) depolymerase